MSSSIVWWIYVIVNALANDIRLGEKRTVLRIANFRLEKQLWRTYLVTVYREGGGNQRSVKEILRIRAVEWEHDRVAVTNIHMRTPCSAWRLKKRHVVRDSKRIVKKSFTNFLSFVIRYRRYSGGNWTREWCNEILLYSEKSKDMRSIGKWHSSVNNSHEDENLQRCVF